MANPGRFIFILFVLVQLQLLGAGEEEPEFSAEQWDKLDLGEVVFIAPEPPHLFTAAIRIEVPASVVWQVMLDQDRVPEYVKDLKEVNVLESGENWKVIEHRLMIHPLLPLFYYVFREEYGPEYSIAFNRVRGSFKQMTGWWKLIPSEDEKSVILMYSTLVDVGFFIPKSWIRMGIRKKVPALLTTFRDVVLGEWNKTSTETDDP